MESNEGINYIEELEKLDTAEWLNIPQPIISAFNTIKNSICYQSKISNNLSFQLKDLQEKFTIKHKKVLKSTKDNNSYIKLTEDKISTIISELETSFLEKNKILQDQLAKDLDTKTNWLSNKLLSFDERLHKSERHTNTWPTLQQIETKIKTSCDNLRDKIRLEIRENLVNPEIQQVNRQINIVRSNFEDRLMAMEEKILSESNEFVMENKKILEEKIIEKSNEIEEKIFNLAEKKKKLRKKMRIMREVFDEKDMKTNNYIDKIKDEIDNFQGIIDEIHGEISKLKKFNRKITKSPTIKPSPSKAEELKLEISSSPFPDEFQEQLFSLKQEILNVINSQEEKFNTKLQDTAKQIEKNFNKSKEIIHSNIIELSEKLSWLPINLRHLDGMSGTEARLFTLEARLRSEENSRMRSHNTLLKLIESLTSEFSPLKTIDVAMMPLISNTMHFKTPKNVAESMGSDELEAKINEEDSQYRYSERRQKKSYDKLPRWRRKL
ncbi:unnamed protein product [Blepharisma stoltei]|uniref:Uncharacterized protein n=1 Tax=Blepharisma stoltei TaxID=1481888 RepID=A0AAU9KAH2_9CILI|nr:unnamed protein product [Blepharisma stoltei]